jgi:hypothetical protein
MRKVVLAVLFAVTISNFGVANAADGCGLGCRQTSEGACVVDGWGTGARVRNECPAGARPSPPCGEGYAWSRRYKACFQR